MLLDIAEQRSARVALQDAAPLVMLHGPSGGGKSHLLAALADGFDGSVSRLTAPGDFTRDSQAVVNDEPDLLIVEDLQFLPPGAVERLLRRLDERLACGLRTVVTATAGPRHLRFRGESYPSRLTSRLAGGLVVNVPLPGIESRRLILASLLESASLDVPEAVIADVVAGSRTFRGLLGAVEQLKVLARLQPGPMDAGPLVEHFRQQMGAERTSVDRIVQRVAGHFQVAAKDVRSRSRRRGFVVPRHVSMYLARRLTPLSLNVIGAYFGGCDHATVLHACRKMERTLVDDPQLGGTVRQLQDELAG